MESALLKRVSGAPCSVRPLAGSRRRCVAPVAAVQELTKEASTSTSAGPVEEIYIGFEKEDGFGSREGRKGRVIKDDPRKYPSRDAWGTGGWAGGEVGLWQVRDTAKVELAKASKPVPTPKPSASPSAKPPPGQDLIYVGFGKDEIELRKSGAKGRLVIDDPTKYPGKEDIGPLAGVAGGFAGGEAGVKQFVATGDIRLRKPGEPGPRQFSPLTLAGVVALAGAVGGVVLDVVSDAGENGLSVQQLLQQASEIKVADLNLQSIDDNTKILIAAAAGLVVVSSGIIGAQAALKSLQEKLRDAAKNTAIYGTFGLVVFLIAKSILESE